MSIRGFVTEHGIQTASGLVVKDDRLTVPGGRLRFPFLVVGTDRVLSRWWQDLGNDGPSFAAWACESEQDWNDLECWVERRSDMLRVRRVYDGAPRPYRPKRGHLHVYVVRWGHPALPFGVLRPEVKP